jgi:hypothetical protein
MKEKFQDSTSKQKAKNEKMTDFTEEIHRRC